MLGYGRSRSRGTLSKALLLAVLILTACISVAGRNESRTDVLEIRAATELKHDDDVRIRSEMLGCDPCTQVTLSDGERYLMDPTPMASVPLSEVQVAYVGPSNRPGPNTRYELIIQLSDDAAKRLRQSLPRFPRLVMNSYGGKPVGVSASLPLKGMYSIAPFGSADAAKKVAAEMGLRVKEIPFDEEAVRKYQQQVDRSE